MIVAGFYMVMSAPQSNAALPVSSINSCGTAVAAMNAGLTGVASSRLALKAANKSHNRSAINRAKKRLAAAEAQRDVVRTKIKSFCGAGVVTAQAGGCSPAIDKLAVTIDLLAKARADLAVVAAKKPETKSLKAARTILAAKVRKLEQAVDTQSDEMQDACSPAAAKPAVTLPVTPGPAVVVAPDTTAPVVAITVQTPTKDTTPHVDLSANESGVTFECKLNGGPISAANASLDLSTLTEQTHVLACRGTDSAGNVGAFVSKNINVDLTAPNAPLVTGATSTQTTHLSFGVSPYETGDVASCKVDAGAYAIAPNYQFTHDFAVGNYHVICVMTDAAGNTSLPTDLPVEIKP